MSTDPNTPKTPGSEPPVPSSGPHLTTISHEGRFWDVYVEFKDDPRHPDTYRARFCFFPGDPADGEEPSRTAVVLIEPSYEEVMHKARAFGDPQLQALLRSVLP